MVLFTVGVLVAKSPAKQANIIRFSTSQTEFHPNPIPGSPRHRSIVRKTFLHMTWLSVLFEYAIASIDRGLHHIPLVLLVTLCYAVIFEGDRRAQTPQWTGAICGFLQLIIMCGNALCMLQAWDKFVCIHSAHVLFQLNMSVITSNLSSSSIFSLLFILSTAIGYVLVYGISSVSCQFVMPLSCKLEATDLNTSYKIKRCYKSC